MGVKIPTFLPPKDSWGWEGVTLRKGGFKEENDVFMGSSASLAKKDCGQ